MHNHVSQIPLENPCIGKVGKETDCEEKVRSRYRSTLLRTLVVAFSVIVTAMLASAPASVRATDCAAMTGTPALTPDTAPQIDCPNGFPCTPNGGANTSTGCSCYGGACAAGPSAAARGAFYSNCGPITTCVLLGADPPISNSNWSGLDLTGQGPPGGARTISGKCPPPSDTGQTGCPTCPPGQPCGSGQLSPLSR